MCKLFITRGALKSYDIGTVVFGHHVLEVVATTWLFLLIMSPSPVLGRGDPFRGLVLCREQ